MNHHPLQSISNPVEDTPTSRQQLCYFALISATVLLLSATSHAAHATGKVHGSDRIRSGQSATQTSPGTADALPLATFLEQVKGGHTGVKGAKEAYEGQLLRSREAELLTMPTAFFQTQYTHDGKPQVVPLFTYDFMNTAALSLGVSKLTDFGLSARLSTNITSISYDNAQLSPFLSAFMPAGGGAANFANVNTTTSLELTQSLLGNGFGRGTRSQKKVTEAGALAAHFSNRYATRGLLAQAETTYWRLAVSRQAVELAEANLDRSQKNFDWNERRARLQLADQSDALQAQAILEVRKLDIQRAKDEERNAARAFNSARGIASDEVRERLDIPTPDSILAMQPPQRAESRDDVKAAEQQQYLATAQARVGRERDTPTLDVFGQLALNGQDQSFGQAYQESFSTRHPTAAIGVRFSAPIAPGTAGDSRAGYRREELAADLNYQRKVFEQEESWRDLNDRLAQAKRRLQLAVSLEKAQRAKLDHERNRYRSGRTTAFQVLTFESDSATSELGRIQSESEVLGILTQMKLFNGEDL